MFSDVVFVKPRQIRQLVENLEQQTITIRFGECRVAMQFCRKHNHKLLLPYRPQNDEYTQTAVDYLPSVNWMKQPNCFALQKQKQKLLAKA